MALLEFVILMLSTYVAPANLTVALHAEDFSDRVVTTDEMLWLFYAFKHIRHVGHEKCFTGHTLIVISENLKFVAQRHFASLANTLLFVLPVKRDYKRPSHTHIKGLRLKNIGSYNRNTICKLNEKVVQIWVKMYWYEWWRVLFVFRRKELKAKIRNCM